MGVIGRVTTGGEAKVALVVRSGEGREREIESLVDTGFNGSLALPTHRIDKLGLSLVGRERMLLASGDLHFTRTYRAFVELDGQVYSVRVVEGGEPLIGMTLLWGYDLHVQCKAGGSVVVEAHSREP
jgi:clan AA aspartic protease